MQPSLKQTGLRTSAGVLVRWPDNVNGLTHYTFFTPDSGTAPSYGLGTAGSSTANVASTWVVKARDAGGALADPGVVASGNIIIEAAAPAIDPAISPAKRINVDAITQITGTGHIDILTNGWIIDTEKARRPARRTDSLQLWRRHPALTGHDRGRPQRRRHRRRGGRGRREHPRCTRARPASWAASAPWATGSGSMSTP